MDIPNHLSHRPIVAVDYSNKDAYYGDARYLSIGTSTWSYEEISAKIFRTLGNGKWARQSEELPLWRLLDLATLLIGVVTGQKTYLEEETVSLDMKDFLESYINDNQEIYTPRLNEIRRLLNNQLSGEDERKSPNIFSIATSELSQDAVLAWLMKWADDDYLPRDYELCHTGKAFVSLLTGIPADVIHRINVGRQWRNIDIWAEVNDDIFIAIEDKTGTTIHDEQLQKYRGIVEEEYSGRRRMYYAYIKTENEPDYICNDVIQSGYKVIRRMDLLSVLELYTGFNDVLVDFRKHLYEINSKCDSFKSKCVDEWDWYAWQGFYSELEKYIQVEGWSYVANPAGGFLGLWWHFIDNGEIKMYLQFEESKLCIKIEYNGPSGNRSTIRNKYYERLFSTAKELGIKIERPARFGSGIYMTIGVVPKQEIFNDTPLDFELLIRKLVSLEHLVDETV